jgi:hypothetical protein
MSGQETKQAVREHKRLSAKQWLQDRARCLLKRKMEQSQWRGWGWGGEGISAGIGNGSAVGAPFWREKAQDRTE